MSSLIRLVVAPKMTIAADLDPSLFSETVSHQHAARQYEKVSRLVQKKARSKWTSQDKPEPITLDIWDFAGQELYYVTHQVFLSWRAVYLLTFDLSKDLDEKVTIVDKILDKVTGGTKSDLTRLQFINFWLSSIVVHSARPDRVASNTSPPIFIVGTHRDSIKGDKDTKIKQTFTRIRRSMKGKPYANHVIPKYYAVENERGDDDAQMKALNEHIHEVASKESYMGEEVPLKWLHFEQELKRRKEDPKNDPMKDPMKNMNKIKCILRKLDIATDQQSLQTMLTFYHDLGKIIFFGRLDEKSNTLNDLVILDPVCLIGVFKKVITTMEPEELPQERNEDWITLSESGILEESLLNHVWQQIEKPMKLKLIDLMRKFDLICDVPGNLLRDQQSISGQQYCIPSMLSPRCTAEKEKHLSSLPFVEFFVDFDGIFTVNLFHRLMSRMCADKENDQVELYYRQILLPCEDAVHSALLEILPPPKSLMKVRVYRLREAGTNPTELREPDPKIVNQVMTRVREVVTQMLKAWTGVDASSLTFLANCPDGKCDERFSLELCYKSDNHRCGHLHFINLRNQRSKFGITQCTTEESDESKQSASCIDETKRKKPSSGNVIYLLYGKDGEEVRKVRQIIELNGWSVITPRDSRLRQLQSQAREDAMKRSHTVIILTESYINSLDVTHEIALIKSRDTKVISIVCCDLTIVPDEFKIFASVHIGDADLEERFRQAIDSEPNDDQHKGLKRRRVEFHDQHSRDPVPSQATLSPSTDKVDTIARTTIRSPRLASHNTSYVTPTRVSQGQESPEIVTENELYTVAETLPHAKFHRFCHNLAKKEFNEADSILIGYSNDYIRATRKVLADWKTDTGGMLVDLCTVLEEVGAGGIGRKIKQDRNK